MKCQQASQDFEFCRGWCQKHTLAPLWVMDWPREGRMPPLSGWVGVASCRGSLPPQPCRSLLSHTPARRHSKQEVNSMLGRGLIPGWDTLNVFVLHWLPRVIPERSMVPHPLHTHAHIHTHGPFLGRSPLPIRHSRGHNGGRERPSPPLPLPLRPKELSVPPQPSSL